uniref:UBX domain-containing protein n=2 Tax=Schistocephalus solidus TaxID=70667 RepID=A0A0X3P6R2_SCHSO
MFVNCLSGTPRTMDMDFDIDGVNSFKAITGIEDFDLALEIMRNFNWNLDAAVNNYFSEPDSGLPSDNYVSVQHPERQHVSTSYPGNVEMLYPESGGTRNLEFRICLSSTDTVEDFMLPDSRSLRDLKEDFVKRCGEQLLLMVTGSHEQAEITAQNLVSAIEFDGLRTGHVKDETAPLRVLHLPLHNYLTARLLLRDAREPSPPRSQPRKNSFEFKIRVPSSSSSSSSASSTSSIRSRETSRRNGRPISASDCSDVDTAEQIIRSGPETSLLELGACAESVTNIPSDRQSWSLPSAVIGSGSLVALVKDLNLAGQGDSEKAERTLENYNLQPGGSYTLELRKRSKGSHRISNRTSSNCVSASTSNRDVHTNAHRHSAGFDRTTSSIPRPSSSTGSLTNSSRGDQYPNLSYRQRDFKRKSENRTRGGRSNGSVVMEDDETDFTEYVDDDYLQLTDDFNRSVNNAPLIPLELIDSPVQATENFSTVFLQRYCRDGAELPPPFACCRLDEALDGAFKTQKLADRKPLFIYLHDDKSIGAHIFATRVLCSMELHQFFNNNDINIWPWDVTLEEAKAKVLRWIEPRIEWLANKIRSTPKDDFPLLIMVVKLAGSLEVLYILNGRGINLPTPNRGAATPWSTDQEMNASFPVLGTEDSVVPIPASTSVRGTLKADELVTELWNKLLLFNTRLEPELDAEKERLEREQVRAEQDHAYRESLRQDQLKMKAKKEEEEDTRRREQLLQLQAEREKAEALAECRRHSSALPKEPPEPGTAEGEAFAHSREGAAGTATLRFRLPPGLSLPPLFDLLPEEEKRPEPPANGMLIRRFRGVDTLSDLKHFMESLGFTVAKFKLLTTFPRTDLTAIADDAVTVAELKLVPQETLILEER